MEEEEVVRLVSLVPVRQGTHGTEFCLCREGESHRWQFPEAIWPAEAEGRHVARSVAQSMGLSGQLLDERPFAQFEATRDRRTRQVNVFVLLVDAPAALPAASASLRWCLMEEVQVRLRPKSIQRVVDAIRRTLERFPPRVPGAGPVSNGKATASCA